MVLARVSSLALCFLATAVLVDGCGTGEGSPDGNWRNCEDCDPGFYNDQWSWINHRPCQGCSTGKFQADSGASGCDDCTAGTYQNLQGQASCKQCELGTYQNLGGQASCKTLNCPAGSFQQDLISNVCNACPVGKKAGSTQCETCTGETFQNQEGQTSCKPWRTCSPGTSETSAPTTSTNRQCAPCSAGFYQDQPNRQSCKAITQCTEGVITPATPSSDAECFECASDEYIAGGVCVAISTCPIGEGQTAPPNQSTDRVCAACVEGETFSDVDSDAACEPVTECAVGEEALVLPTVSSDTTCRECGDGFFQDEPGQTACKPGNACEGNTVPTTYLTPTNDYSCTEQLTCTANDETCSCAENCDECEIQSDYASDNILLVLDEQLPEVTDLISCSTVTAGTVASMVSLCSALCDAENNCEGFALKKSGTNIGQCCLRSFFRVGEPKSSPGFAFFKPQGCAICASGFVQNANGCRLADTLPTWTQQPPTSLSIPLDAEADFDLFTATATATRGPVTYTLSGLGGAAPPAAFSIDSSTGVVSVSAADLEGGTVKLTIWALDAGSKCHLEGQNSVNGPCAISSDVIVNTLFYVGCPASFSVFIDASQSSGSVSWTAPTIPSTFDGLYTNLREINGYQPGDSFPSGETTVQYTTDPVFNTMSLKCTFSVTVVFGVDLVVNNIGHVATSSQLVDYLVDNSGATGGGSSTGAVTGDLWSQGLTFGISAPANRPFSLSVLAGFQSKLSVDLKWCTTTRTFPEVAQEDKAIVDLDVTIVSEAQASVDSIVYTKEAFFTSDGECLSISVQTETLPFNSLVFSGITLSLAAGTLPRRRRDLGDVIRYLPVPPGAVAVQYTTTNGNPILADPGSFLTLDDTVPPLWIGCPFEPVEVAAAAGAPSQVAFWTEPSVIDNVAVESETQTHSPGDPFSVTGSPHTVKYTAFDSRQSSTCEFQVHVSFPGVPLVIDVDIDDTFPTTTKSYPSINTMVLSQLLFDSGSDTLPDIAADLSAYNELVWTFTPPPGDQLVIKSRPNAVSGTLMFDLEFRTSGSTGQGPAEDVLVTYTYRDYVPASSPNAIPVDHTRAAASALVNVNPATGLVLVSAQAQKITDGFQFSRLDLTVAFPDGRSGSTATYVAQDSHISVSYTYNQVLTATQQSAEAVFLTIQDSEPPLFSDNVPADIQQSTDNGKDYATVFWTPPTATDNRGTPTITSTLSSGSQVKLSDSPLLVVYTATDLFGNTASANFTITVVDTEPPTVTCSSDAQYVLPSDNDELVVPVVDWQPLLSTDNSGVAPLVVSPTGGQRLGPGTTKMKVTVVDVAGLNSSCIKTITVKDETPPSLTCPALSPVPQDTTSSAGTVVQWSTILPSDNVGLAYTNLTHESGDLFPVGETLVSVMATDTSNLSASCQFTVEVTAAKTSGPAGASGGDSSTVTLGAGVGVGVLLIVLLVLVVLLVRARRRHLKPTDFNEILKYMEQVQNSPDGVRLPREIKRPAVRLLAELGQGAFGTVWKAMLQESSSVPGYLTAVKLLHEQAVATDRTELLEEAAVMAQFQHDNVVALIGVVTVGKPIMVVLEFMERGSLLDIVKERDLSPMEKLAFSKDCAAGLAHIHSKGFVHRDVAARNVLVSTDFCCKIADFGLARDSEQTYYRSRGGQLPVRWTAPEALDERKFWEPTDVWSMGVLMFEVYTRGETPYKGWTNNKVWVEVQGGYRLPQPQDCPTEVYEIMQHCWHEDPGGRPSFEYLVDTLDSLLPSDPDAGGYLDVAAESEPATSKPDEPEVYNNVVDGGLASFDSSDEDDEEKSDMFGFGSATSSAMPSTMPSTMPSPLLPGAAPVATTPQAKHEQEPEEPELYNNVADGKLGSFEDSDDEPEEPELYNNVADGKLGNFEDSDDEPDDVTTPEAYEEPVLMMTQRLVAEPQQPNVAPPAVPRKTAAARQPKQFRVGDRVKVLGYDAPGVVKFVGKHHVDGRERVGVMLDDAVGLNNGVIRGHPYFECAPKHGVLVAPAKVSVA